MGTRLQELCELLDTHSAHLRSPIEWAAFATRTKQETNWIGQHRQVWSLSCSALLATGAGIRLPRGIFFNAGTSHSILKQSCSTHSNPRFPAARLSIRELSLRSGSRRNSGWDCGVRRHDEFSKAGDDAQAARSRCSRV